MTRTFAAAMRRANRLTRSGKQATSTRSIQKAINDFMATSALAAFKSKAAKSRKAAAPKADRTLGSALRQRRAA